MLEFMEVHECKMDAKGRILLPVALKKQLLGESPDGLVLKRSAFNECLELFPMSTWKKEMKHISKLNRYKRAHNEFIRRFMAGAKQVSPDSTGRIIVAKDLLAFSGISKNVVISSSIDRLEVWDKDKYESSINESEKDFGDLTEEVMGGLTFDEPDIDE